MSLRSSPLFVRARLSVALLLDRRAALFACVDAMFVFSGLMMAFSGNGRATEFWPALVLMPTVVLGVPMLAEVIAVERRSGTLDLALSSPGAQWYFERRIAAASTLLIVQAWIAVVLARIVVEPFPVAMALVQAVVVITFIAAVVLNWAVRLKSAGSVVFATFATLLAFAPWFFANPIHPPAAVGHPLTVADVLAFVRTNLVLGGAAAIFYLFAAQRLSKPESIIT